jgi:hypothetical protein
MAKPKWPRVSGGKCIEKWEIETDSGPIPCRTYMIRGEEATHWVCVARLGDDEFVKKGSKRWGSDAREHLDDLEERFRKEVRERVAVVWKPHLYVEVSSSHLVYPDDPDRQRRYETFDGHRSADLSLQIKVAAVDLGTTGAGEKRHRGSIHAYSKTPTMGWPEVGPQHKHGYGGGRKMYALIEDTPANREAVEAIRRGMQQLNAQLHTALSPEHIEKAFANVHRLLPAGEES